MRNNIPIFLSSDNNYAPFVATTIASICDNTKNFCEFYVLDGGISDENKAKIGSLKNKFNNFSVEFVNVDKDKYFKNFITNSYITVATYYRLVISQLYPKIQKFLYLDVDVIVCKDITLLFNEDLEQHIIGAVEDRGNNYYINNLKYNVGLAQTHSYFNAGVLLINNKKWIDEDVTAKLFKIEETYRGHLECNDQDVLNKYFENNYEKLPIKYNSQIIENDTVIRHYYQHIKPWHINPNAKLGNKLLPDFEKFWEYAKITPFYDELLNNCKYPTNQKVHIHLLYKKLAEQKKKIAVSIIIPIYNTGKYLQRCLDSIIHQSLLDIEIICINDSSTDNSLEILKEYAEKDDRIKLIDFKENKGVSVARNAGIDIAKGEYLSFVDSDDCIDLKFYEKLYNKAIEGSADIVKGNLRYIDENNKTLNDFKNLNDKIRENKFNFNCNFSSAIYKASLIKSNQIVFQPDISCGEDRLFQIMALLNSNKIEIIDDVYYNYIRHTNSLTTNNNDIYKKSKDRIAVLTLILRELDNFDLSKEDYTLLFNELFIQIIEGLRLHQDIAQNLYSNIITLLKFANVCKLPKCFEQLAKTEEISEINIYNALIKYVNFNLLEKIRHK